MGKYNFISYLYGLFILELTPCLKLIIELKSFLTAFTKNICTSK